MTKSENWPMWLSLPWVVVFIWMMLWTPKTKKGWYLVGFVFCCQLAVLLYFRYSK